MRPDLRQTTRIAAVAAGPRGVAAWGQVDSSIAWPYRVAGPARDLEVILPQQSVEQRVLEAVEALPADATIEDAMERLYFLARIQRGLEQADAGETMTHEQAKNRLLE